MISRKKKSKEDIMFEYCISEKLIKDIFESMQIYKSYKLTCRLKGPGANYLFSYKMHCECHIYMHNVIIIYHRKIRNV